MHSMVCISIKSFHVKKKNDSNMSGSTSIFKLCIALLHWSAFIKMVENISIEMHNDQFKICDYNLNKMEMYRFFPASLFTSLPDSLTQKLNSK